MKKRIGCILLSILLVLLSSCTTASSTPPEPVLKEMYKSALSDEQAQIFIDTMKVFNTALQDAIKEQNLLTILNYSQQLTEVQNRYDAAFQSVSPRDFTLAAVNWDIGAIHANILEIQLYYYTFEFYNSILSPDKKIEIEPVTEIKAVQGTGSISLESCKQLYESLLETYFE